MNAQEQLVTRFYTAFAALDAAGMAACYAEDARFDDEVFHLTGKREVVGMWSMLSEAVRAQQASGAGDWKLLFRDVHASPSQGSAHWEADYRFSATGRPVHNVIDATFGFDSNGLIATHTDRFDFWRWSRQALGPAGVLLGWTPLLRRKVRARAAGNLQRYLARTPG